MHAMSHSRSSLRPWAVACFASCTRFVFHVACVGWGSHASRCLLEANKQFWRPTHACHLSANSKRILIPLFRTCR
eukprot:scaffold169936_cov26-Tisochrysis_lutea.AAC.3